MSGSSLPQELLDAESKAQTLFEEAVKRSWLQAGKTERELNEQLYTLAYELFGIKKYWHKRIVRAGSNTLLPYRENPPERTLNDDDIVFFDFGPVFDEWEADFGRTYVLGNDPKKHQLVKDIAAAWQEGKAYFEANKGQISGAELYRFTQSQAQKRGWQLGNEHAGHLIGNFPHEKLIGDELPFYIHPESTLPMKRSNAQGQELYWIYEIHFTDPQAGYGGFYEQLLG